MQRALFITTIDFSKIKNGGALYSKYLFEFLGKSTKIDAVILRHNDTSLIQFTVTLFFAFWHSIKHGVPFNVSLYNILGKRCFKKSNLNISDYDLVIFDHVECFTLFDRTYRGLNVLIAHNIEADIMVERFRKFKFLQKLLFNEKSMKTFEDKAFRDADCIVCISALDKKYIQKFNHSVFQILPLKRYGAEKLKRNLECFSFGFIGSFDWSPNLDAVGKIVSSYKDLFCQGDKLLVAGGGWESFDWTGINVKLLGFVDSVDVFYRDLDFLICPIISGGGVPVKVLEALNYGVPVLTTQRVIDAIFASDVNECQDFGIYLIDDFREKRCKLMEDPVYDIKSINDDRLRLKEFFDE